MPRYEGTALAELSRTERRDVAIALLFWTALIVAGWLANVASGDFDTLTTGSAPSSVEVTR